MYTSFTIFVLFAIIIIVSCIFGKRYEMTFIHIPKNAGTFIEELGKENGYKWGIYNDFTKKPKPNNRCSHWHIPPRYFKDDDKKYFKNSKSFCIFRDPHERIISEFKYINRRNKNIVTKDNLNKYIHSLPNKIEKDKLAQDCHLIPQYEYIYDTNGDRFCDEILDFKNLNADIHNLNSKYHLGLKNINTSKKNDTSFSGLTKNDLDEQSVKIIESLYAKDFKLMKKFK